MTTPVDDRSDRSDRAADDDGMADDDRRAVFWEAAGHAFRPYAGWLFFAFGALLVLLGWVGISGESVVAKQLPYLISGGLGGVLLAILGAYFLGIEELRKDGGRLDRMERQIEELHRLLLERPDAPPPPTTVDISSLAPPSSNGHVYVVESGESYHRSGCALVAGKTAAELESAAAVSKGLRPCPVCEPV